jgi:hypothetical protein
MLKHAALLMALAAAGCAPSTASTPKSGSAMPSSVMDPYLKIQVSLARDSVDDVKANAGNLTTAATALGAPAMKIFTASAQLTEAADITDARDKFGVLSEALVAYMDGLHLTAPDGVRVALCPMKLKPWLQAGANISNPYYGSSMPTCGSFRP